MAGPAPVIPLFPDEPFTDVALDAAFAEFDSDHSPEVPQIVRWSVHDTDSAEWAMQKVKTSTDEVRELEEQAQEWKARVDLWLEQATRAPRQRIDFFSSKLIAYQAQRRAQDERRNKTLFLPSGEVKSTGHTPKVEVQNEAEVLDWVENTFVAAEEREAVVKTTSTVKLSGLRDQVRPTPMLSAVVFMLDLSCGHHEQLRWEDPSEFGIPLPEKGDDVICSTCVAKRTVLSAVRVEEEQLVPVSVKTGEPVPGCAVSCEDVTFKVVPR